MGGDALGERAAARHQPAADDADDDAHDQADRHVLEHEAPPDEVLPAGSERGGERQHRREAPARRSSPTRG